MNRIVMKKLIKSRIEELLSKEFYCSLEELNEKTTVYSVNSDTKQPYIKILAYRNCVVVCSSKELSSKVRELLQDKTRDEIFELPLVYGQTIHFVPAHDCTEDCLVSASRCALGDTLSYDSPFECECLFGKEVLPLSGLKGFGNSLVFDENGFTEAKAVYVAKDHHRIIGVAGAAESMINDVWEIGVDVREEYRNAGLGTHLVRKLTEELLAKNIVPFYSASVTNIGSQMVANRCGYIPCWVDTFGTVLDGSSVYHRIVEGLAI